MPQSTHCLSAARLSTFGNVTLVILSLLFIGVVASREWSTSLAALSVSAEAPQPVTHVGVAGRSVDVQLTAINSLSELQKGVSLSLETEVISVTRRGFEPQAISRPKGQFILMIENSQAEKLNLQLSHETGPHLRSISTSRAEPEWNDIQNLTPGRYVLTEQNHPDWKCFITITPR